MDKMDTAADTELYEAYRQRKREQSVRDFGKLRRKYEELQAFKAKYYKGIHTPQKIMHEIVTREAVLEHIASNLDFPEFWLSLDLMKGLNVPDPEI